MNCIPKLKEFLQKEKGHVMWLAVTSIGVPVKDETGQIPKHWSVTAANIPIFDGYTATRVVRGEEGIYKLECVVKKSFLGKPTFTITAFEVDGEGNVASTKHCQEFSLYSSVASNKILRKLKVPTPHNWSGTKFFGFDRKPVSEILLNTVTASQKRRFHNRWNDQSHSSNSSSPVPQLSQFHLTEKFPWLGVQSFGKVVVGEFSSFYERHKDGVRYLLRDGYTAHRGVETKEGKHVLVTCKIKANGTLPRFICEAEKQVIETENISKTVTLILNSIGPAGTKNWSGQEFFGLYYKDVLSVLSQPEKLSQNRFAEEKPLQDIANIRHRNAGPTGEIKSKMSVKSRNEKINNVVKHASFGDIKSYVSYLLEKEPDLVESAIEDNDTFKRKLEKKLLKAPPKRVFTEIHSAELLTSRSDLSQRGYNNIKRIFKCHGVELPSHESTQKYIKDLDLGPIVRGYCCCPEDECMSCGCDVKSTIEFVLKSKPWFDTMVFSEAKIQEKFFNELKKLNSSLYGHLDPNLKTLFIRLTGDNFRAACKFPTEQLSFSFLNNSELLHSPYGQFVASLFRGSESRENLDIHGKLHYNEIKNLLFNGFEFDGEKFNVVPFLCADLSFVKEILGKCSCTSLYGCFYCKMHIDQWGKDRPVKKDESEEEKRLRLDKEEKEYQERQQTIADIIFAGDQAIDVLGEHPDHATKLFTSFQQSHYGQYAKPLLDCIELLLVVPCGLHLILAHHRYLWNYMFDLVTDRKQQDVIPDALRAIGCSFLALQVESYFKSKKKYYDGSSTLKMIGRDCKQFELNIEKFILKFLKPGEQMGDKSFTKMKSVIKLYHKFRDLAKDIRSKTYNEDRVGSFQDRVEKFFVLFKKCSLGKCTERKPYLHILRDHVSRIMKFYGETLGWGYGYFNCNAGEHLNKLIKTLEIDSTNLSKDRFLTVTRLLRVKQLYYPKSIFTENKKKCSICKIPGHNKNNKNCPNHPEQPKIESFPDSENEEM